MNILVDLVAFVSVFCIVVSFPDASPSFSRILFACACGGVAVPLGRFGRQTVQMTDPFWTAWILVPLLLFFGFLHINLPPGVPNLLLWGRTCFFFVPTVCIAFFVTGIVREMRRTERFAKNRRLPLRTKPVDDSEPTYGGPLCITKSEAIALAITAVIVFLFRIHTLIPLEFVCDEYYHNIWESPPDDPIQGAYNAMFKTGRFTAFALCWPIDKFVGVSPFGTMVFLTYVSIGSILLGGVLLSRFWGFSKSVWATTTITLLIAFHPYLQNALFYRGGGMFIGFPLIVYSYWLVRCKPDKVLLGAFLIAVGIGMYQAVLNVAATAFLITVVIEGVRELKQRPMPSFLRIWCRCRVAESFFMTILACVFYFLMGYLFVGLLNIQNQGYVQIASLSNFSQQLANLISVYTSIYTTDRPIFAPPLNIIPFLTLGAAVGGTILLTSRTDRGPVSKRFLFKRLFLVLFSLLLLALSSYTAALGVSTFIVWDDFPPRIILFTSLFIAAGFTLAWLLFQANRRLRAILLTATYILLSAYALFLGELITNSFRLVQYDRAKAIRIVADLEKLPEFNQIRRLSFIPFEIWRDPELSYPLTSSQHWYFESAFAWYHARVELINAVSGYDFRWMGFPESVRRDLYYDERYADIPVWPAPGSIAVDGDTAVIRLKPPTKLRLTPQNQPLPAAQEGVIP